MTSPPPRMSGAGWSVPRARGAPRRGRPEVSAMAQAKGQVLERCWKQGRGYALRFHAYGERQYLTLGMQNEGWTRRRAETELANILADVRRGTWIPPQRGRRVGAREDWRTRRADVPRVRLQLARGPRGRGLTAHARVRALGAWLPPAPVLRQLAAVGDRHRSGRRLSPLQGPASRAASCNDRERQSSARREWLRAEVPVAQLDQQDDRRAAGGPLARRRVRAHSPRIQRLADVGA